MKTSNKVITKIIALDQSLTCTGYTIVEMEFDKFSKEGTFTILDIGKITTKKTNVNTERDRRKFIAKELDNLHYKIGFDVIIMEDVFLGKNPKTANTLSTLRGFLEGYFANKCDFYDLKATVVRLAVVKCGSASKEDVAKYLKNDLYKDIDIVQAIGDFTDKQNKRKNSDMYDSLCIATAYINNINSSLKLINNKNIKETTIISM